MQRSQKFIISNFFHPFFLPSTPSPSLRLQALQAAQFLDKIKLFGKPIRVTSSKHTTVQLPKEGAPDGGLTKDFSNSPLHRFKKPGSKNYANVFPPSATLHLSNIPPDVEEQTLVDAFNQHGHVKGKHGISQFWVGDPSLIELPLEQ